MLAVSTRTSCRQLFKELNILTSVSLHIMEVIYYIRKHHQFVELNSNIHAHNARRKMDIHIQSYNTVLCERSVGTEEKRGTTFRSGTDEICEALTWNN